jgi:hypothetical protein
VQGSAGETIVAEVHARRLDSPLDSMLKVTDAKGKLLALNDDHDDVESGLNTHHADSFLTVKLPADGTYYVHIGDTARNGGEAYAYRLRISAPQPDFALRVVPSGAAFRSKAYASVTVYAVRREGFNGPIKVALKDPPEGYTSSTATLPADKQSVRLGMKTTLTATKQPVNLTIAGTATIDGREVSHEAVAAEDRMQAFLWRHLVPAEDFPAVVYDPAYKAPLKHTPPELTDALKAKYAPQGTAAKFTKGQVAGRLRQLGNLYQESLFRNDFYLRKVAECEASL